jgi:hypothetical protein
MKVVIDVWDDHNTHLARFLRPLPKALSIINREIRAGYIVNLAQEDDVSYGQLDDFDKRKLH